MSSKTVFALIGVTFLLMCVLYIYMSGMIGGGIAAALVMLIVGFFFATVSGYLVGVIGSSNNPISGLTLSTLVIAALLMVVAGRLGHQRRGGRAGRGRGGVRLLRRGRRTAAGFQSRLHPGRHAAHHSDRRTDRRGGGQLRDVFPADVCCTRATFNKGGIGFGDRELSAPQAGLMASLAQGIVGGDMAWPLVIAGILMGFAMIMFKVKSPMLVAIGMYLPVHHHLGHLRRRRDPLDHRRHAPPRRLQRGAERARGKRRRAGGFRPDRRRSAGRPGHRHVQFQGMASPRPVTIRPIWPACW